MSETITPYKVNGLVRYGVDNAFTDEDGIFHRLRRRGFETERAARSWSRKTELATREGIIPPKRPKTAPARSEEAPETWTTDQVWERCQVPMQKALKATSMLTLCSAYRVHVAPRVGNRTFCLITKRELDDLAADPGAVPVFGCLLKWAARIDAPLPVGKFCPARKKKSRRLIYLEPPEAQRAIELLDEKWRPAFIFAIGTGMRLGEICGIRWGDIEWPRRVIHIERQLNKSGVITTTKSGEGRIIPLSDTAARALDMIPKGRPDALIFPSHRAGLQGAVKALAADLPKPGLCVHSLRHTCASWAVIAGVSLSSVARLLGHRHTTTADIYAHLAPRHLVDGTSAVDRAMGF